MWTQIEVVELTNDGSGLGFGISGNKSTGVVVKAIVPGSIADKVRRSIFFGSIQLDFSKSMKQKTAKNNNKNTEIEREREREGERESERDDERDESGEEGKNRRKKINLLNE